MHTLASAFVLLILAAGCVGQPQGPTLIPWQPKPCDPEQVEHRALSAVVGGGASTPRQIVSTVSKELSLVAVAAPFESRGETRLETTRGNITVSESGGRPYIRYDGRGDWIGRDETLVKERVESLLTRLAGVPLDLSFAFDAGPYFLHVEFGQRFQGQIVAGSFGNLDIQSDTPQGGMGSTLLTLHAPFVWKISATKINETESHRIARGFLHCELRRTNVTNEDTQLNFGGSGFGVHEQSLVYELTFSHAAPEPPNGTECAAPRDRVLVDVVTGAVLDGGSDRFCEPILRGSPGA